MEEQKGPETSETTSLHLQNLPKGDYKYA